jgi:hypothetical protein
MFIRVMHQKSVASKNVMCGEQFTYNSMMGWDGEESEGVLGGDAKMVHMQSMNLLFSHVS